MQSGQRTNYFANLTPEEAKAMRQKAVQAAEDAKKAAAHLKQEWSDAPLWRYLQSVTKAPRFAPWYIPSSDTRYIKRTLSKIGKDYEWYGANFSSPMAKFGQDNPNVPAWVLQGLILEAAYPELVNTFRNEK